MWCPVIGTDIRIVRDVRTQLKQRPSFPMDAWKGFEDVDGIVTFSKRLASANEWPNHHYGPEDPVDLLFFFTDGDGWQVIDLIQEWEKRVGKEFPLRKRALYGELFVKSAVRAT
jgi:hypothetical protein